MCAGPALGGILAVLHSAMDMKATIGGRLHSQLYYLATAMRPRMLMTLDTEGALLAAPVRVGQAVDGVAQAGRRKAITGVPPAVHNASAKHCERLPDVSVCFEKLAPCRLAPLYWASRWLES